VIAEDDLVVLHYHLKTTPDDLGQAVVDIFRVEDGRIVEHWDVLQAVPPSRPTPTGCSEHTAAALNAVAVQTGL